MKQQYSNWTKCLAPETETLNSTGPSKAHTHFSIRAYAHSTRHLTWSWRQFETCLFDTKCTRSMNLHCFQMAPALPGISDPAAVTSASGASTQALDPTDAGLACWRRPWPHTWQERAPVPNSPGAFFRNSQFKTVGVHTVKLSPLPLPT